MSSSGGNPNAPQPPTGRNVNKKRPCSGQNSTSSSADNSNHIGLRIIHVPEPRVLHIDAAHFKDLVIKLTGMPQTPSSPSPPATNAAGVSIASSSTSSGTSSAPSPSSPSLPIEPQSPPDMEMDWTLDYM